MGYSLKSLKEELISKNLADYGLVAWGQNVGTAGLLFGAIGAGIASATAKKVVISMVENSKIAIFPFTNKEIKYNEGLAFDKTQIESAKLSGLISKTLKIKTTSGKKFTYPVTQGAKDVKEILTRLGF
jgi:hypothetical protein